MVPKGSRPAARKRTTGCEAQCGGGMWRGIWLVRVGYALISCLVAIMPPAAHTKKLSSRRDTKVLLALMLKAPQDQSNHVQHTLLPWPLLSSCTYYAHTTSMTSIQAATGPAMGLHVIEALMGRERSGGRTGEAEGDGDDEPEGDEREEGGEGDCAGGAGVHEEHVEAGQRGERDAGEVGGHAPGDP